MDAASQLSYTRTASPLLIPTLSGVGDSAHQHNWIDSSYTSTAGIGGNSGFNVSKFGDKFLHLYGITPPATAAIKGTVFTYTPNSDYTLDTVTRSAVIDVTGISPTDSPHSFAQVKLSDGRVLITGGVTLAWPSGTLSRSLKSWIVTYNEGAGTLSAVTTDDIPAGGGGYANGCLLPDNRVLVYSGLDTVVPGSNENYAHFGVISGNTIAWTQIFTPSNALAFVSLYDGVLLALASSGYYLATIVSNSVTWGSSIPYPRDIPWNGYPVGVATTDGKNIFYTSGDGSIHGANNTKRPTDKTVLIKATYDGTSVSFKRVARPTGGFTFFPKFFGIGDNGRLLNLYDSAAFTSKEYLYFTDIQSNLTYSTLINADLTAEPTSLRAALTYKVTLSPNLTDYVPPPGPSARLYARLKSGATISADLSTAIYLESHLGSGAALTADLLTRVLLNTQMQYGCDVSADIVTAVLLETAARYGVELSAPLVTNILLVANLECGAEVMARLRIPVPQDIETLFVKTSQNNLIVKSKVL